MKFLFFFCGETRVSTVQHFNSSSSSPLSTSHRFACAYHSPRHIGHKSTGTHSNGGVGTPPFPAVGENAEGDPAANMVECEEDVERAVREERMGSDRSKNVHSSCSCLILPALQDSSLLDSAEPAVDLTWCSGRDVPWHLVLEGKMRSSLYYLKTCINRKADMHRMIEKYARKFPGSQIMSAIPRTHIVDLVELQEEEEELCDHLENIKHELEKDGNLWVLKASDSNRGLHPLMFVLVFMILVVVSLPSGQDVHLFSLDEIAKPKMMDILKSSQSNVWLLQVTSLLFLGEILTSYRGVSIPRCCMPHTADILRVADQKLRYRDRKFHLRVLAVAKGDLEVKTDEGEEEGRKGENVQRGRWKKD
eukprot:14506-Hanusia_phi.AAC.2